MPSASSILVLAGIRNELSNLIARAIYDATKKIPPALSSPQETAFTESGSALPGVLQELEEAFMQAMDYSVSAGFAKWQNGKSQTRLTFYLASRLIGSVRGMSDWARAAKRTADGAKQVAALGGDAAYQMLINDAVPQMVVRAIAVSRGHFRDWGTGRGWRVLTPVISAQVAHLGKTDFVLHDLFYLATGSEKDTGIEYRRAKKLLLGSLFRKPTPPVEGPYFD